MSEAGKTGPEASPRPGTERSDAREEPRRVEETSYAAAREETVRAEAALRESAAKLSSIISIAADAIVSVDEDQKITIFNRGAEQIFGYTEEEVLGKPLDLLIPESVRDVHRQHVEEFGRSGEMARRMGERGQVSGRRKNGEVFPADSSISQVEIGGKKFYTAVLRDVTANVHAEEALRQANENLHALIQASPLAVITHDAEGAVEIWNAAAERMLGWTEAEVLGQLNPAIPEEKRAEYEHALELARHGEVVTGRETERLRKDGSRVPVSISTAPLRGASGEYRGVVIVIEDVTRRREAEDARRRVEERERFVSAASRALSGSLEYGEILRKVTDLLVPRLADFYIVDIVTEGGEVHREALVHRDHDRQMVLDRLRRFPPRDTRALGVPQVLRTGEPALVPEVTEAALRAISQGEAHLEVLRALAPRSLLIVLLQARGRVIGAISCAYTESGRRYGDDDLLLAEDLAGRARHRQRPALPTGRGGPWRGGAAGPGGGRASGSGRRGQRRLHHRGGDPEHREQRRHGDQRRWRVRGAHRRPAGRGRGRRGRGSADAAAG